MRTRKQEEKESRRMGSWGPLEGWLLKMGKEPGQGSGHTDCLLQWIGNKLGMKLVHQKPGQPARIREHCVSGLVGIRNWGSGHVVCVYDRESGLVSVRD